MKAEKENRVFQDSDGVQKKSEKFPCQTDAPIFAVFYSVKQQKKTCFVRAPKPEVFPKSKIILPRILGERLSIAW